MLKIGNNKNSNILGKKGISIIIIVISFLFRESELIKCSNSFLKYWITDENITKL